jgi:DNA-directed RNA polymerase sigma subunit (sigma70/sigma32)
MIRVMAHRNEDIIKKYIASKHRLQRIPARYLEAFEYRHGIADGTPHTQAETGRKFAVSKARIGQFEARVKYELEQL